MKNTIRISDFTFLKSGHGHYRVTYRSPITGKEWSRVTDNMPLVDATRNEEKPLKKDLEHLRRITKNPQAWKQNSHKQERNYYNH